MIEAVDITFGYDKSAPIFAGFNWTVRPGESWAVIGPSGCGKTTLLYMLAALRLPSGGSVRIGGQPIRRPRRQTGLILQDHGLLPWATARENVTLGLRIRGETRERQGQVAERWLARLGLAAVAGHYPQQLSGGQRQRVAIARTLALDPDLLLMDEPFSSLDAITREQMQDLVLELAQETRLTVVLVTHNIEEAVYIGGKVLVLPRAPIARTIVIENDGAGERAYRGQAGFYHVCADVREQIEELCGGQAE